jgi:hypothetical protein
MVKVTEEHINEIAGLLDCGLVCFFHTENGTIESHPDDMDVVDDHELWQEIIDKIELEFDKYIKFEKMDSSQSFRVIADFVDQIDSHEFKTKLMYIVNHPKPFRHFKHAIDNSDYRQDWFEHKDRMYVNWVREQLK